MDGVEKFCKNYVRTRKILDYAHAGFNPSLMRVKNSKRKTTGIIKTMDDAKHNKTPQDVVYQVVHRIQRRINNAFANPLILSQKPEVCGDQIKSMDQHIKEAIQTFSEQMQALEKQFKESDSSEKKE